MAQYLVTGGCGFIGSHLVASLVADGHHVRVIDNLSNGKRKNLDPDTELIVADVADGSVVARCMDGIDGCFHLAAVASVERSTEAWLETHRTNLGGAIAVFEAARARRGRSPVPVVFASSAAIYGANQQVPLTESSRSSPLSAYGADKLGCELHGSIAAGLFGIPVTALRFFNVYGPRQDPASPYSGVISIFGDNILRGKPLTVFGDGSQSRDFVYVADAVRFLRTAMQRSPPKLRILNVCTGKATTISELAMIFNEISGGRATIQYASPRIGDIHASAGDPSLAKKELGLATNRNIRDGLTSTFSFFF